MTQALDTLTLRRFAWTDMGVFGDMHIDGRRLYTVERPWLDNRPSISCIPEGSYACRPRRFFRGGYDAVEIAGVEGRTHILFHRGNTMLDVLGCIAVCSKLGVVGGLWAGLGSAEAFGLFMEHYNRRFTLRIYGYHAEGEIE